MAAPRRRRARRLLVLAALVGAAFAYRDRQLARNARRYGLPG